MSKSTKTYRLLPWVVALLIALLFVLSDFYLEPITSWMDINPAFEAHKVKTVAAIDAFHDGTPSEKSFWVQRAKALGGILILFVIGPSLWIFGEIRSHAMPQPTGDDLLKKGTEWYLGVTLVGFSLMLLIPQTTLQSVRYPDMRDSSELSRTKDHLRLDLSALAYEAAEIYYLPQEFGGGSGSFYTVAAGEGEPRPFRMADISRVLEDTPFSFSLGKIVSDSVLTIYGLSEKEGKDPNFKNVNGDRGKIQMAIRVEPEGKIFEFDRSREN